MKLTFIYEAFPCICFFFLDSIHLLKPLFALITLDELLFLCFCFLVICIVRKWNDKYINYDELKLKTRKALQIQKLTRDFSACCSLEQRSLTHLLVLFLAILAFLSFPVELRSLSSSLEPRHLHTTTKNQYQLKYICLLTIIHHPCQKNNYFRDYKP